MACNTQKCSVKDKRLLVLLSFGCMIILMQLAQLSIPADKVSLTWEWYQKNSYGPGELQRKSLNKFNSNDEILYSELKQTDVHGEGLSPRVLFLLGLELPINRADVDELTMLPGIGPKLGLSIIQYREIHGPITDPKDLTRVPGIGKKTAIRISRLLTFDAL